MPFNYEVISSLISILLHKIILNSCMVSYKVGKLSLCPLDFTFNLILSL